MIYSFVSYEAKYLPSLSGQKMRCGNHRRALLTETIREGHEPIYCKRKKAANRQRPSCYLIVVAIGGERAERGGYVSIGICEKSAGNDFKLFRR
jgi:hypothetical protein